MRLMGRAEASAIRLTPGFVDPPLTQSHLEQNPEQHRHQKAARELGGDELPAEQDQEDEAELEDEVGGRELEDDRVGETRSSAKERSGHRNRSIRAGRAR